MVCAGSQPTMGKFQRRHKKRHAILPNSLSNLGSSPLLSPQILGVIRPFLREVFDSKNPFGDRYYLVQNIGYTRRVEEGPEELAIGLDRREVGFHPDVKGFVLAQRRLGDAFLS